jgi:outer membrane scaffolding protein for murein synthesis (MipA/OmpV family)
MKTLLVLALSACGAASAQTPASNPMPDGSHDMYVGLGALSAPRYEGAADRKLSALPVLQVQWSNGLFVAGMSAGLHLSNDPAVEFGPLLAVQPGRTGAGSRASAGGVENIRLFAPSPAGVRAPGMGIAGMDEIGTRLQAGFFLNRYVAPRWRLTSSMLYGSGNDRTGALLELGAQRLAAELAPHHTLSVTAGITVANRDYNQAFFGVTPDEALRSGFRAYRAAGGIKDLHLGARWNWSLSPELLLTTSVQAQRLGGSAIDSPLAERPTNLAVSSAIAWRF